jgi:Fe2+ or Zn2+ uptake regulation protein
VEDLMESAPGNVHQAAQHAGHDVTSHTLVLYGRCRECRESR